LFHQEIGMPPSEYILRKKIELAKEMLLAGATVTQTAFELDFSSSQYFATVFKRYTGESPRDFLRKKSC
jgi:AraC-like DNA-binding protein